MNKKIVYTLFTIFILTILLLSDLKLSNTEENKELISSQDSTEKGLYAGVSKEFYNFHDDEYVYPTIEWKTGYTIGNVNVRTAPTINSEIINTLPFNTQVEIYNYNDEWSMIRINLFNICFISNEYISDKPILYKEFILPDNSGMKTYMPYTAITNKSSYQYKLQKQYAYTGQHGIRQVRGRFCVAIGTAFDAPVGTYIDLILKNGTIIPCVVADIKADIHTKEDNITTASSGCVSEFVCDAKVLNKEAKKMGDVSYVDESWNSKVIGIRIYKKNIFEGE